MIIIPHLGLGDAIVLSGAVAHFAQERPNEHIVFPCWKHNEDSVKSFFVAYPNVWVWPIVEEKEMLSIHRKLAPCDEFLLGFYGNAGPHGGESFDAWFYRQMGLPLSLRWDKCPIKKASEKWRKEGPVLYKDDIFLHEDTGRGYCIVGDIQMVSSVRAFSLKGRSILAYCPAIEQAREVHVIDSAFLHLTECLEPQGKLFLHAYARPRNPIDRVQLRHKWNIIE